MTWTMPVSIKGIIMDSSHNTLLLKDESGLWELPGGKMEKGEQPEQTLIRELHEELRIQVRLVRMVNNWVYHPGENRNVFFAAYLVDYDRKQEIVMSEEHLEMGWFALAELEKLPMAEGYKQSIRQAQG